MKMATIGKVWFGYLFFTARIIFATCDIQVKVLNQVGLPVSEVSVGVPFQLHIIAKGDCDIGEVEFSPAFDICKMSALGTVKSVSNINRVINHTITYRYNVRIDQVGNYTLGPIRVKNGNQVIGSAEVVLKVRHNVLPHPSAKHLVLELKSNKQKVYVGERFTVKIRFYFNDLAIKTAHLNLPGDFKDKFEFEVIQSAMLGSEMQNGHKVPYLEWDLAVSARQAGDLLMPALSVIFEKTQHVNQFFIFQNQVQEELFSNALMLQVSNLPPIERAKQGDQQVLKYHDIPVGVFGSFSAKIDHTNLKEGQAAQLVLSLAGDGNWNKVNLPLTNVPHNLQSYAGSITQQAHSKEFEYVLQGVQKGVCKLPEQTFFYFDPDAAVYKTLKTKPIELNVMSVSVVALPKSNFGHPLDSRIRPLMEVGAVTYQARYYLPIWLFMLLVFLPILILIFKTWRSSSRKQKKLGFSAFKAELSMITKNKQSDLLYGLFTNILMQEFNLPALQISADSIDSLLRSYHVPVNMCKAFCNFYYELAAVAFAKQGEQLDLFIKAQDWLNFLERLVVQNGKKN